jgi:hypothetical protein
MLCCRPLSMACVSLRRLRTCLVTVLRCACSSPAQCCYGFGQVRAQRANVWRWHMNDLVHEFWHRLGSQRQCAREQLEQGHTQRVRSGPSTLAPHSCSGDMKLGVPNTMPVRVLLASVIQATQNPSPSPCRWRGPTADVRGFDIAMHDMVRMGIVQNTCYPSANGQHLRHRQ